MLLTQHWFWYPGQQMEGINGTPKTLGRHYKREWSQQQKPFNNKEIEQKDHLKNFLNFQKERKEGKHCKGS